VRPEGDFARGMADQLGVVSRVRVVPIRVLGAECALHVSARSGQDTRAEGLAAEGRRRQVLLEAAWARKTLATVARAAKVKMIVTTECPVRRRRTTEW